MKSSKSHLKKYNAASLPSLEKNHEIYAPHLQPRERRVSRRVAAVCGHFHGHVQELAAKGKFLTALPLYPVAIAITVRMSEGKSKITKGPFTETTEQLGGYYIIKVANPDEAITIA